jgi:hypothetical protein
MQGLTVSEHTTKVFQPDRDLLSPRTRARLHLTKGEAKVSAFLLLLLIFWDAN